MIRTNLDQCVEIAASGEIGGPDSAATRTAADGSSFVHAAGGIALNVKVGDSAFGWAGADEVEPGAAVCNCCDDSNAALELLACVGNDALVTDATFDSKEAKLKGAIGTVTGKSHGRVLVHFPKKILEKLVAGDRIQVRSQGNGLKLLDYGDVTVANLGPRLLRAMNLSEKGGKVRVQVTKVIPGRMLGAGAGDSHPQRSHFDIQSTSAEDQKFLEQVRLGDIVTVMDVESSHGPRGQKDAITVGVVCHGGSRRPGHGLGINVLMTSAKGQIEPILMSKANLANYLGLA